MGNVLSDCRQVHYPYKVKRPYQVDSHSRSTINAGRFARASPNFHARSYYERLRPGPCRRKPETRVLSGYNNEKGVCFSWISTEIGRGHGDEPLACKSPTRSFLYMAQYIYTTGQKYGITSSTTYLQWIYC